MQNAKRSLQNKFKNILQPTLFLGLWAVGLTGCEATRETFCKEMPVSAAEVASFKSELDSRFIGRRIASTSKVKPVQVAPSERDVGDWMVWTEKTLKQTQWARDSLEKDKSLKKAMPYLKEASLSLVSLHGFLEQKKWRKVYGQLEQIEDNLEKINALACAPVKDAGDRQPSSVEKRKKKKTTTQK